MERWNNIFFMVNSNIQELLVCKYNTFRLTIDIFMVQSLEEQFFFKCQWVKLALSKNGHGSFRRHTILLLRFYFLGSISCHMCINPTSLTDEPCEVKGQMQIGFNLSRYTSQLESQSWCLAVVDNGQRQASWTKLLTWSQRIFYPIRLT